MSNRIKLPEGVRNNNPLNIEVSPTTSWEGAESHDTHGKLIFRNAECGIRAAVINLHSYKFRDGCFYLVDFIKRWAPPVSNPTANYLRFIRTRCGLDIFDQVMWPEHVGILIDAMIMFECDRFQYPPEVLARGIECGLHPDRPAPLDGLDMRRDDEVVESEQAGTDGEHDVPVEDTSGSSAQPASDDGDDAHTNNGDQDDGK